MEHERDTEGLEEVEGLEDMGAWKEWGMASWGLEA
jgi:hypothetical protein